MLKSMLLGLGGVGLTLAGIAGLSWGGASPGKPEVVCCGACKAVDDCLEECGVQKSCCETK